MCILKKKTTRLKKNNNAKKRGLGGATATSLRVAGGTYDSPEDSRRCTGELSGGVVGRGAGSASGS